MERTAPLLAFLLAPACVVAIGGRSTFTVDGVRLHEEHTETIEIAGWEPAGLELHAHAGDVVLEPTDGPSTITLTLHEVTVGDAMASYEDGKIVVRTKSGEPSAIGDVTVRSSAPLPSLFLETGMGDVRVEGVSLPGRVKLETGMGDVFVTDVREAERIEASSGMGGIEIARSSCRMLTASSGMGDIRVDGVQATEASFDSGMGDVTVRGSTFEKVKADTGIGNIDCRRSTLGTMDLDSGLGSVRTR